MAFRPAVSRDLGAVLARDLRRGPRRSACCNFATTRFSTASAIICSAWESVAGSRPPRRHTATRACGPGGNGAGKTLAPPIPRGSVFGVRDARAGIEIGSVRFPRARALQLLRPARGRDVSPTLRLGVVLQSGVGYELSGQTSAVWKRGFAVLRLAANGLDSTRTQAE